METEESHACKICNEVENNESNNWVNNWVCTREKGAKSLNSASRKRGMETEFYSDDWLHKRCRCDLDVIIYLNII